MNLLIRSIQILFIIYAGLILSQLGFFKNANWPNVICAAFVSGVFAFYSLRATIRTINSK